MREETALQKFASGMSTLLKVAEDYPDALRERLSWEEYIGALQSICEAAADG